MTPEAAGRGLRSFWVRHRTLFWSLHSIWALLTGVVVMVLARERYGFVPWVVLFLVLTWISTLTFGRRVNEPVEEDGPRVPGAAAEATSYVTRTLYQETLFFLLPFYLYSTVASSPNVVFTGAMGALALFSCLDLVFDRLLRTRPLFSLLFFAVVAFAALNLLLPILWALSPRTSTTIAALVAVTSALPLALRATAGGRQRLIAGIAGVGLLMTVLLVPSLVPPVPLRLDRAQFSEELDRETLEPIGPLDAERARTDSPVLFVVLEVFAPGAIPASISLMWRHDGTLVRQSREIEITAHEAGFRVWDAFRSESAELPPGDYQVTVRTSDGRIFGRSSVTIEGV